MYYVEKLTVYSRVVNESNVFNFSLFIHPPKYILELNLSNPGFFTLVFLGLSLQYLSDTGECALLLLVLRLFLAQNSAHSL